MKRHGLIIAMIGIFILGSIVSGSGADNSFQFYSGVHSPLKEILQIRLEEAFTRIGKKVIVTHTGSSQRALLMANQYGDGDVLRVADIKTIAPEITINLVMVPESIMDINFHVYTIKKDIEVNGYASLSGLINGIRIGAKILEKNVPSPRIILPDSVRLFKMLDQGRLDTVIEHNLIAEYVIRDLDMPHVKRLEPALEILPGYCYIHKKHAHLINRLAEAFAEMKKDGRFLEIEKNVLKKR